MRAAAAQRRRNAGRLACAAKQRGMAAGRCRGVAHCPAGRRGAQPALRAAPFDQLFARKRERRRGRRHRQPPQRRAVATDVGARRRRTRRRGRAGRARTRRPAAARSARRRARVPRHRPRRARRRSRSTSVPSHQALALSGSGWPPQALRRSSAARLGHLEAQRGAAGASGSTFSDTSQITPSMPIEPASRRETS